MFFYKKIYYSYLDILKNKKVINLFGIKFTIKQNNNIVLDGDNNHIYLINSETMEKKEVLFASTGLNIEVHGDNNIIEIMHPIGRFENTKIFISKTSFAKVRFENNVYIPNTFISIYNGKEQNLLIKKYTSIGSAMINIHENSSLEIGEDCMFSDNVIIWCADGHALIDIDSNKVLNFPPKCLKIGNHCWIGYGTKITKNAGLQDNVCVAAFSVLTKSYDSSNCVVAGVPGKIIKYNTTWSRLSCENYVNSIK